MSQLSSVVLGTRTSELALWQTNHVIEQLQKAWPTLRCERMPFVTKGDRSQAQDKPLPAIGGKGLFTAELEESLRSGQIDLAVHSLKDLPVEDSPGLTIGAICSRADVRDALVARNGWTLATLPKGATVGTSSTRRAAQLLAHRPDLTVRSIRGNVPTRVRKVMDGDYDATLLAVAGLARLGLMAQVTEILPLEIMLPAPGQGALAVQCRADDQATLQLLAAIDDLTVRVAVTAERAFLHTLGGGCSAPVAAYAHIDQERDDHGSAIVHLSTLVCALNGQEEIRVVKNSNGVPPYTIHQAVALGDEAAREAVMQGAGERLATASLNPAHRAAGPETVDQQLLRGKRVVVTRAEAQAESLATALAMLGAEVLAIPTIRIEPLTDLTALDAALQNLNQYRWLIFTSVNSVAIVAERLAQQNYTDAVTLPRIAAIGDATAAALQRYQLTPSFVPERYVAEAIVDGLGDVNGQRILLPQAEIARETLADRLTTAGATVDAIPIYQTLPAPLEPAAGAALARGVDLLTFTSSSTAHNFFAALPAISGISATAKRLAIGNPLIACIGPVTAETVRGFGLQVDIVATDHTIPGLVKALTTYYTQL